MATPLVFKSLQNFVTAFHYCWACPLDWNTTRKEFVSTTSLNLLIPWRIVVFGLIPAMFVQCVAIILLNIYGIITPPLKTLLLCSILGVLTLLGIAVEFLVLLHAESLQFGCNYMIRMAKRETRGTWSNFTIFYFSFLQGLKLLFLFYK